MKLKLKELMILNQILKNMIDQDNDRKIQTLFKFKILGILKNMETPIANFEVIRNEKIKEYGTKKKFLLKNSKWLKCSMQEFLRIICLVCMGL